MCRRRCSGVGVSWDKGWFVSEDAASKPTPQEPSYENFSLFDIPSISVEFHDTVDRLFCKGEATFLFDGQCHNPCTECKLTLIDCKTDSAASPSLCRSC